MHPIKQKLAYIKGIGRNRFGYWDNKKGSIILSKYIEALENHVWSNEQILEIEVIKITKMQKSYDFSNIKYSELEEIVDIRLGNDEAHDYKSNKN